MTFHRARGAPNVARAGFHLSLLARRAPALLVGLALIGSLSFGIIPAFMWLHIQGQLLGTVDPRLVDVGMGGLNAALLVAFVTLNRSRRARQPSARESGMDEGLPPKASSDADRAPG